MLKVKLTFVLVNVADIAKVDGCDRYTPVTISYLFQVYNKHCTC